MALHGTQTEFGELNIIGKEDVPVRLGELCQLGLRLRHCEPRRLFFFAFVFPRPRGETQEATLRRWRCVKTLQSLGKVPCNSVHHVVREDGRNDHVHVQQRLSRSRGRRQSPLA